MHRVAQDLAKRRQSSLKGAQTRVHAPFKSTYRAGQFGAVAVLEKPVGLDTLVNTGAAARKLSGQRGKLGRP